MSRVSPKALAVVAVGLLAVIVARVGWLTLTGGGEPAAQPTPAGEQVVPEVLEPTAAAAPRPQPSRIRAASIPPKDYEKHARGYLTALTTYRWDTDERAWTRALAAHVSDQGPNVTALTFGLFPKQWAECRASKCESVSTVDLLNVYGSGDGAGYEAAFRLTQTVTRDGQKPVTTKTVWIVTCPDNDPRVVEAVDTGSPSFTPV